MPVLPWMVDGLVRLKKFTRGLTRRTWWQQQEQFTYLSKRKQSTSFPCCEKKLVHEVFMILLTFQFKIVWQIVWQKSSAKADNLITAVKTRRSLEVDFRRNFRTLMEHNAFLSTWCRTFMHVREKMFSSWTTSNKISHQIQEKDHYMWCLWELPWALRVKVLRK